MATVFGIDHKTVMAATLAATAGVAAISTYRLYALQKSIKSTSNSSCSESENVYESEKSLNEYLAFHYGSKPDLFAWNFELKDAFEFPKRCAELCMKQQLGNDVPKRALDIGCAVGRSSFELTRQFDEVIGIDYSQSFVDACKNIKDFGGTSFKALMEGELYGVFNGVLDESLNKERAKFRQGDACVLPSDLGKFGCVLAANLICRLHTPKDFFNQLPDLVAKGGILVITTPYTFMTEYTPKKNWIGAMYTPLGEEFSGFEGMKWLLKDSFELIEEENMPFLIRETRRKNQLTVAHASVWRRK